MVDTEATSSEEDSQESDDLNSEEEMDLDTPDAAAAFVQYSGQDFDVNGLVRRLQNGDILIPSFGHEDSRIQSAGFQRSFVWRRPQMDKFIESLLLGYPIPGIFLVRQSDNRYLVLDGQQRLTTLRVFTEGVHQGKEFALQNVADEFKNLTYRTLPPELRRRFDNTFIQAILVASDSSPESLESVYNIFERLNSGGTQLTPHEIRVALYAGPLIEYVERLNRGESWRSLYGKPSPRLRDQELVFRILALFLESATYRRPLKKFLNDFASKYRNADDGRLTKFKSLFERATDLLMSSAGPSALRFRGSQVTAAFSEAVFVGLITRLAQSDKEPSDLEIERIVEELKSNSDAREAFTRSTADEEQVSKRLNAGLAAFGGM